MKLREYVQSDRESVIDLHLISIAEVEVDAPEGFFDDLGSIESTYLSSGTFIVAEDGGELVGMGGLRIIEPGVARINRMRVHPFHQRKGIGRKILKKLEEKAQALSAKRILLNTLEIQEKAQKLYESSGYNRLGEGSPDGFKVVMYEKLCA